MSSLKKNLGYQTIYQILTTCLPLITSPYLSRVLGASQLGVFSYTQSVVAYFTLFAMLGFANYGTRSIAMTMNDKEECSKTFWSIYFLQIVTTLIAISAYIFYLNYGCKDNKIIAMIQMLEVFGCLLNINWLFFGLEKFKITVTRNIFIRISTVILILLLVKSESDLWIYALLMVGGTFLSQLVLWFYVPKYIHLVRFSLQDVLKHIKPTLVLFIPLAAMSIYHVMDKTMLGAISGYEQSGYYYNADKVINIPAGIVTGFGTVLFPRISALIGANKKEEADKMFNQSLKGTVFVASALAFGIAAISNIFTPIFFGKGYDSCILLIIVLSPVLIIKGVSSSVRYQYLIPHKMDKIYIKSIFSGAITNLVFNILLIPKFGALGAVIGTLMAELVACIVQFISIKRYVDYKKSLQQCFIYILMGFTMFCIVQFIGWILPDGFIIMLFEIILGVSIYFILSIIYIKITSDTDIKYIMNDITYKILKIKLIK